MRRGRLALPVLATAVLAVATGPAIPAGAQDPSPSPAASPGLETVVAEAFADGLAELTTPEAMSEAARELVALDRERLAAIDPGLPEALDDLEAESEAELAAWLKTVLPTPEPEASPAPTSSEASPGPSPKPEGRGGHDFLAAVGPRLPDRARTFDQGGSYLTAVGQVAGSSPSSWPAPSPTRARTGTLRPRSSGVIPASRSATPVCATRSPSASRSRRRTRSRAARPASRPSGSPTPARPPSSSTCAPTRTARSWPPRPRAPPSTQPATASPTGSSPKPTIGRSRP